MAPPNAYEAGVRKVIPAVLVYVTRGNQVLMIHRNTSASGKVDFHEGRWNGIGGKLEADESPLQAAQREIAEESGLSLKESEIHSLGAVHFPNFKPHKNEDWTVFVFWAQLEVDDPRTPFTHCGEGDLHWVAQNEILALNLWPGDRTFVPLVLDRKPFLGTIWYEQGQVVKTWIQPLRT